MDRCTAGYATMEGYFKGSAQCTTSCSTTYPYITYWMSGQYKMCNKWC